MPNSPERSPDPYVLSPDEAFALLGNETRVGILQALWDAFESGKGDNALPYSELFEQVDIRDSGDFSYHLEKLTGPFVRGSDEGYELKQTGINVVRAIVAGTMINDPEFGPTRVDIACPICVLLSRSDTQTNSLLPPAQRVKGRCAGTGNLGSSFSDSFHRQASSSGPSKMHFERQPPIPSVRLRR